MLEFIRKLFSLSPTSKRRDKAGPKPRRFVEIVGDSRYQDALSAIAGGKTRDGHNKLMWAQVVPEDEGTAVRVEIQGRTVGYLTPYQAQQFRKRSQTAVECRARIVGGWDDGRGDSGHFGVKLDLTL